MAPGYGRPPASPARRARTRAAAPVARGDDRGMTPPLPLPVRVAAGLVATAVEQARDLPRLALELPVTAVSQALQASMRVQQKVTELAIKGDQVLGMRAADRGRAGLGDVRRGSAAAPQRPEHGAARPGRDRDTAAILHPTRSSSPARSIPARSTPARSIPNRRRRPRRRATSDRPGRPARLRLADHPPAARQAAPPRRRRPARAAGLGAGPRRPAAVRDHAQQPDRGGHRGVTHGRRTRAERLARPHRRAQDRRLGGPARAPCGWRASSRRSPRGRARAPRSSSCATRRPTCRCSSPPRSGWSATAVRPSPRATG